MTAKAFEIQVQDDHLARIAHTRKPILALAELIWNAVDADATRIDVTLINNDLDGLEAIEVTDNGHGIPYAQAEDLFSRLGGSWKQSRTHSNEENRILHGKEGRGRFRAFSLGRVVEWDVRAADPSGALQRHRISMIADRLRRVEISAAAPSPMGRVGESPSRYRSPRTSSAHCATTPLSMILPKSSPSTFGSIRRSGLSAAAQRSTLDRSRSCRPPTTCRRLRQRMAGSSRSPRTPGGSWSSRPAAEVLSS